MLLLLIMDGDIKPPFPRDPFTVWNLLVLVVGVCSVMGLGFAFVTRAMLLTAKRESTMIEVKFLHPRATMDHVGMTPFWLSPHDPDGAVKQLDKHYGHGGGWHPMKGFVLRGDNALLYPGDPPLKPIAELHLRDELILVYDHAIFAVIQPDRSFEAARMD